MKWLPVAFCFLAGLALPCAASYRSEIKFPVQVRDLGLPGPNSASAFALQSAGEGRVALAWLERSERDGSLALFVSVYGSSEARWSKPVKLATGEARLPAKARAEIAFSAGEGANWAVAWTASVEGAEPRTAVFASLSRDGGRTWGEPQRVSSSSTEAKSPSLFWSAEEGWRAAWLERAASAQSFSPAVGALASGASKTFGEVAAGAEGACSLLVFPDGTELLSYRGLASDGSSDPWMLRRWESLWEEPRRLGREGWKVSGQQPGPVSLSSSAPRVAAAWYTASDGEPRILTSSSPDAGQRWTSVARVDLGHPVGDPALLQLSDRSQLVAWAEGPGDDDSQPAALYLRRYAPNGGSIAPALLERLEARSLAGAPSLCLFASGANAAELCVAFRYEGQGGGLRVLRLSLPSRAQVEEYDRSCNCGPSDQPGFSIRGRVLSSSVSGKVLRFGHDAVPGILRKGELEATVEPVVAEAAKPGRGILGRLEWREGRWFLSDVRLYAN